MLEHRAKDKGQLYWWLVGWLCLLCVMSCTGRVDRKDYMKLDSALEVIQSYQSSQGHLPSSFNDISVELRSSNATTPLAQNETVTWSIVPEDRPKPGFQKIRLALISQGEERAVERFDLDIRKKNE